MLYICLITGSVRVGVPDTQMLYAINETLMLEFLEYQQLSLIEKIQNCINHFEQLLDQNDIDKNEWRVVLHFLSEVNEFQYLDEWYYKLCEILPNSIQEETDFLNNKEDWEYVNKEMFDELKELYSQTKQMDRIEKFMEFLLDMCSAELYSDSRKISKQSYPSYQELVRIIEQ